jgi:hypothetical protein
LGFDLASLGLPQSLVSVTKNPAFPSITMGDMANYGGGTTSQDTYYSRSFNTTVSKFMGKHSIKTGFDFRAIHDDGAPSVGPSSFGFTDVFTRANPKTTVNGTGGSLATMLLGYPTSGSQTVGTNFYNYVHYWGTFIQDDWRIAPKLTLNFGLRLEHESGVQDTNNHIVVGFDPKAASPFQQTVSDPKIFGALLYAGVNGAPTHTFNPIPIKWGPRFGFAYAANSKTAIRGGYGIFWAPVSFSFQSALGYSQSTPIITSIDNNFTPAATLENPYPNGLLQPVGASLGGLSGVGQAITVVDRGTRAAGYVQQYSLDVQRQVPAGFVVTLGFIGSHSLHLTQNGRNIDQLDSQYLSLGSALNANVPNPMYNQPGAVLAVANPTIARSQLLMPFPQFTSVTVNTSDSGSATYTALYARVQRRFSGGLTLLASYTWSRNMDMLYGGSSSNSYAATASGPQNAYDTRDEWSRSSQDAPSRFTTAVTYLLPFGKGRAFLSGNKVLDAIVGGWSVNVTGVAQSGYPLSITQPNNNSVIGASYQRPNATGVSSNVDLPFEKRIDNWINPAAFSQAPQFTFGNITRTGIRGPGQINWDASVFKTFSIKERLKAQFRAESLNVTNTPMFYAPNTTFTNPQFGQITSQANYPRLIQLGIRFTL